MTRIDFTPTPLTLETETMASSPVGKAQEPVGKEGFAEVFAGMGVQTAHAPSAKQGVGDGGGLESLVSLRRVEISPSMRLIMPAAPAPDATSLHAFARMQGLDENAIAQLFGQEAAVADPGVANTAAKGDETSGSTLLDPAAVIFAAPLWTGLVPEGDSAWMARAQTAEPDASLVPAGNVLSIGIQRLLQPASAQTVDMTAMTTVAPDVGAEVEIIPLELTLPEAPVDTPQPSASAQLVPSAVAGAKGGLNAPLGTWDEISSIAAANPGPAASVAAVSKALQGESLKAADLASLSAAAFEDAVAHMDSAAADQAPNSGGAGNTGGGWSAAHQTASTQPLKLANVVETGDVAISRQLGEQLAQRMGEQIAQRVMNKLAQGEWQFKFVINPKNLGEIQVNLRMHAGGLDGAFIANQSATREMLGESMQRLRDVLNGLGMNVASLDVGADHSSRQGRQSMASGQTVPALEPQGLQQSTQETMAARRADLRGGDQGWDVLV
ncbi:MAG: hypothetical protein RLZ63_73 [Pseudomonadota bacterium]|jgi:hypothetical protein